MIHPGTLTTSIFGLHLQFWCVEAESTWNRRGTPVDSPFTCTEGVGRSCSLLASPRITVDVMGWMRGIIAPRGI
jgi:hypothetical protein